jgi:hypothetical protein
MLRAAHAVVLYGGCDLDTLGTVRNVISSLTPAFNNLDNQLN